MQGTSATQTPAVSRLDLARLAATPLAEAPFAHVIVPEFIHPEAVAAITADFPRIDGGGSYPATSLDCGPVFAALLEELQGPRVTAVFGEKFGLDLSQRPTMVTLRGQSRPKDGRIHTDSRSKLVTALIYMNSEWEANDGRLRLLNGPNDIEDYAAEVPPKLATLLAFRCSDNAWHGHKPFVGPRRSIQLNWLTDAKVLKRELSRHVTSAFFKRFTRLVGGT